MVFTPAPDFDVLAEIAQFSVPGLALEAIDVREIVRQAIEDDVAQARIEVSEVRVGTGRVRVTAHIEMALRLLCAWIEVAGHTPTDEASAQKLYAVRAAAAEVYAAYDDARRPRRVSMGEQGYLG